jgi:hypothetical protein
MSRIALPRAFAGSYPGERNAEAEMSQKLKNAFAGRL